MEIRRLAREELLMALHLVWEVYAEEAAPHETPENVAEFQQFIKYEHIEPLWKNEDLILFGAFEDGSLCGVSGIMKDGEICLLYVKKEWQKKDVGRMLFQAANQCYAQQFRPVKQNSHAPVIAAIVIGAVCMVVLLVAGIFLIQRTNAQLLERQRQMQETPFEKDQDGGDFVRGNERFLKVLVFQKTN